MKVVFFRPEGRAGELEVFRKEGFEVLHAPLLDTVADEKEVRRFESEEFDAAIVTSKTAVEVLEKYDLVKKLKGKKVIAIGSKTAEKLRNHGIESELPEKFDSESVAEEFRDKLSGMKIALLRSDKGDPVLLNVGNAEEFKLYRIVPKKGEEQIRLVKKVCEGQVDFVVFSSRMMVRTFFELCNELKLGKPQCRVIAIGPPTKRELEKFGVESLVPEEYTFDGVLRLLRSLAEG